MSVIAVRGIPPKWSLVNVVKTLAKPINGHFEALNFQSGGKTNLKICYLRLSEKLDPVRVVEQLNNATFPKFIRPYAFIPDHVPDIPLAAKPKRVPQKMLRALHLPVHDDPDQIIKVCNEEIVAEMQLKYPGLYSLSMKTGHKLLEELGKKILERLNAIGETNQEVLASCFKLSQWYRRMHPHFGDFQLILSTLHAIEDADGTPRTQLQEKEFSVLPPQPYVIDNLPYKKVQGACSKYSDRIIKKVSEHINNLNSEVTETDAEDEVVRKKVREELQKMAPFLPIIVKEVVTKHFIPQKSPHYRIRIYGEPFLPSKETMSPFLKRYRAVRVIRSERMYNMLRFSVPPETNASLIAMDGTVLNGAKLVIRSSDMPRYKIKGGIAGDDEGDQEAMDTEEWEDL